MAKKSVPLERKRAEDFIARYANNVNLQSSAWDLVLTFGQLDQPSGDNTVLQHTAITLPWAQVKILAYIIQVHLSTHEGQLGRIVVPTDVIKAMPDTMPEEYATLPNAQAIWNRNLELYKKFVAENPEAVSK